MMGETRIAYPGLVRPYTEQSDYVNQPKFTVRTMYNSTQTNARSCSAGDHDPFSIYDDDTAHDHYFFLPAGQMEVKRPLSDDGRTGRWSRSKPLVEKHSKPPDISTNRTPRTNRSHTFTNSSESNPACCECPSPSKDNMSRPSRNCARQNNNRTPSTSSGTSTQSQRRSLITKDSGVRSSSLSGGDYCSLSVNAVAPPYPAILRSNEAPIDEEKFRKFANHLIRDGRSTDTKKNSNDYHDPSRTKTGGSGDAHTTVQMYDMDKCIDHCTCMLCIKAGRYHWAGDGDSFIEEPCSCAGGRKNIVRRWLCMGVLALFLPCLICYLPAKLCQRSCSSRRCATEKLKDSHPQRTMVEYVDKGGGGGSEVKLEPTGML